jgi:hypothetical protein
MTDNPGDRPREQKRPKHALDDSAGRQSGAIEDGIVSSTADPDEGIEYGGGKTVPPGNAEPAIPPYEGRTTGTGGGTPGRGENVVSANTGVSGGGPPPKESAARGEEDSGSGPGHTPGTGRAEDKR